jgi:hypothetical protein
MAENQELDDNPFGCVGSATDSMTNDGRRKYRNRKCDWRVLLLLFLLASLAVGVGVGVWQKNKKDENNIPPPNIEKQCNYSGLGEEGLIPNAFVQCYCDGNITIWTDAISTRYSDLRDSFILTVLPDFDEDDQSCDPIRRFGSWQTTHYLAFLKPTQDIY